MKNSDFYSLKKINELNATYNVIFGERSNGKTYGVLMHMIRDFWKYRKQFAIVRRWKEDITGRRASDIFSSINSNCEIEKITNGKFSNVYYLAGKFYLCNYDEKGKAIYNQETDLIAFVFALSDTEHNKSISYPNIYNILFDEFITKHTYLADEFVLFMNTLSTIIRQRENVKIFMLGNTVNKYCPYFDEMGLKHILEMKQGSIDVYRYGESNLKVAVEYCSSLQEKKKNNYYFAFNNPKLKMITSGAWELDIYPHLPVKYKPKNVVFTYFIIFNDNIYQCEIISINNELFTYIHKKSTKLKDNDTDIIYSLDYNYKMRYNRSIYKSTNEITSKIAYFFKIEKVFYQDNSVGDAISNYLKLCETL